MLYYCRTPPGSTKELQAPEEHHASTKELQAPTKGLHVFTKELYDVAVNVFHNLAVTEPHTLLKDPICTFVHYCLRNLL